MSDLDFTKVPPNSVPLDDESKVLDILKHTVAHLWDTIDDLCRLRPTQRRRFHVTIFGSGRIAPESEIYREVRLLAGDLVQMGCVVVTGGGAGLMRAANEGALLKGGSAPDVSVGIRMQNLPDVSNPYTGRMYWHGSFFTRLQHFFLMSDAYVAFPGGLGTLLEMSVIWQLLQVHQLYCTPLILVGDMWIGILDWARQAMLEREPAFVDQLDLKIPRHVPNTEAALAIIREHYEAWKDHNIAHSKACIPPKP